MQESETLIAQNQAQEAEDAANILDAINRGDMEVFPAEFVDKLMDADSAGERILCYIQYRHTTQSHLANEVGISPMVLGSKIPAKVKQSGLRTVLGSAGLYVLLVAGFTSCCHG